MGINHLASLVGKQHLYDNGSARIISGVPIDESFREEKLPSVTYHGGDRPTEDQDYTGIKLYKIPTESPEAARARYAEMMNLYTKELASASAGLKRTYDRAMDLLPPDLRAKDWGFSIASGEMVFAEGSDALSFEERSMLNDAFRTVYVREYAQMAADSIIGALVLARGPAGVTNGFGRFDVNQENFGDIVDLRAYLMDFEPGGEYHNTLVNPNDLESLFYIGGHAMMDQIIDKAPVGYAVPPGFGLIDVL